MVDTYVRMYRKHVVLLDPSENEFEKLLTCYPDTRDSNFAIEYLCEVSRYSFSIRKCRLVELKVGVKNLFLSGKILKFSQFSQNLVNFCFEMELYFAK